MAKVRYKCDYTKLKLCFNKFHNASDDAPKECQFCLLELTDGRYTAGRWDGDDCLENDSVTGKFIRGTADVVEIKEVVTAKLVCHQNSPLNCQILSSKIFLSKRS